MAANQIAVTASGMLTTDVQGSLEALDAGKAATSHTHPASAITDSTAAGRAMLTAATLAAQQALLGLGAQAYVNNAIVTAIGAQIALTGKIVPAALVASVNDWAPTGWSTASTVYAGSVTVPVVITGFLATTDGDIKIIHNAGNQTLRLSAEDSLSAAANRLGAPSDLILDANGAAILQYETLNSRWRLIGSGITQATPAQAAALADFAAALTPATAQAAANATIPVYIAANPATTNPFGLQKLHVREEQASGTASGTFTTGAWRTRTLNAVVTNQISGASLASSQIVLPAGTYDIDAEAPAFAVNAHQAKLRNITDSTDTVIGFSSFAGSAFNIDTRTAVRGQFTIAATKTFEIQHSCAATFATNGFGQSATQGVTEVFTDVMIWKIA